VLELAPPTAEVLYWLAYLSRTPSARPGGGGFARVCVSVSARVHRGIRVGGRTGPGLATQILPGVAPLAPGRVGPGPELLAACGEEPRFGPFYAARAQVTETNRAGDLQTAARLDPGQWRYGAMLARHFLKEGDSAAALATATDYAQRFPTNGVLALLHAKALVASGRYQAAADLLNSLNLLPCEGSTDAHSLFREAHLMLAVARLKSGYSPRRRHSSNAPASGPSIWGPASPIQWRTTSASKIGWPTSAASGPGPRPGPPIA